MSDKIVKQIDILDLVVCAEDYGHWNGVCMMTLYDWAKPVTNKDIQTYADWLLKDSTYTDEDEAEVMNRLTEWRDKYAEAAQERDE